MNSSHTRAIAWGSKILAFVSWLACSAAVQASFTTTGSIATARYHHTATLLPSGKVLVAGGSNASYLGSAELYDPANGQWTGTGSLTTARSYHTATLLANGKVLIAGGLNGSHLASTEVYDPALGTWTAGGSLGTARISHTATLLPNGKVLVVGGYNGSSLDSVELYDPVSGTWTAVASLATARYSHTATLLPDGTVLIAGGYNGSSLASTEIYDPVNNTWTPGGDLGTPRHAHSATLLPNGKVLAAAGVNGSTMLKSAEIYDPANGTWKPTGSLSTPHFGLTATLLPEGMVLATAGFNGSSYTAAAELYDPTSETWLPAGSLATARTTHTATLLPNGRVILVGGQIVGGYAASTELYESFTGDWSAAGTLSTARSGHAATLLPDGRVLVAGGYGLSGVAETPEIYDAGSNQWSTTGALNTVRWMFSLSLLPNGKVLIAGGYDGNSMASTELYDMMSGAWTLGGSLVTARREHTATLLASGKVLVTGGTGATSSLASCELYDPASDSWAVTGSLAIARRYHTATLLPSGKVLVVGGATSGSSLASAELYDPVSSTWTVTGSLIAARQSHTATLLPNGKVLVTGGFGTSSSHNSAELYDPATGTWTATGSMFGRRQLHTATLLPNGKVLVAGGFVTSGISGAELYDPAAGTWKITASLAGARSIHTATLLPSGKVLIAGGADTVGTAVASAELYNAQPVISADWRPQISSIGFLNSRKLLLSGARFTGISEASSGGAQSSATNVPLVQLRSLANDQVRFLAPDPDTTSVSASFTSAPIFKMPGGHALITVFTNGIASQSAIISLAAAPSIRILGQGQLITPGDTTPGTEDGTDFGTHAVLTAQSVHRFTLANPESADLHLTGSPGIVLSGAAVADFSLLTAPASVVSGGSSSTFDIVFRPKAPGLRTVTVSILSDDPMSPGFTFTLSGLGKLTANLAQSITFTPPPVVYLTQSPVTLHAEASSGLPVTLSLVAPVPAGTSLVDGLLGFSTSGTVKVQATCPAGGNYNAAAPVVKTISVKAAPSVPTLDNLVQVYDGTPKAVTIIGSLGSPTATYKVGGSYLVTPPTNAGSYPVKATADGKTITGTLVIAKAPLLVMPDHQFKYAGRANPVLTFSYSGFASGDNASAITTVPVLKTTATLTSPQGVYPITASGGTAANYRFIYLPASLVVASYAGSYEALLMDGNAVPAGKLSLMVAANATNRFTGKLYARTETAALPVTGVLATNVATDQATCTVNAFNSNGIPYVISFTLPWSLSGSVSATVMRDSALLGSTTNGQRLGTAKVYYAGDHTAVFEPSTQLANATPAGPVGAGWATAKINTTGALTLSGRLGDDTAFTAALSPDTLSDPGYRLFAQPYLAPRALSFIAGEFALAVHPALSGRRYLAQQSLTWQKAGLATDTAFRAGFGPVSTVLMIDPWLAPKTTAPKVTLAQRLGLSAPSLAIAHTATGSTSNGNLPTRLALSDANVLSVQTPAANLSKWKTTSFNVSNGTFTGSFELKDGTLIRSVPFSGILRQPALGTDPLIGDGHYLRPPLSGTEKTTGEITLQRP